MRLADFILCEDIRQEVRNKLSLVGIYSDSILFSPWLANVPLNWPIATRFAVYARLLRDGNEPSPDKFEFKISQMEKQLAVLDGEFASGDPSKPLVLALVIPQLVFPAPGNLEFKIVLKKGAVVLTEISVDRPFKVGSLDATPTTDKASASA